MMEKKPDFEIDVEIEFERIKQFASQVEQLPHGLVKDFEKGFSGERSMEYYRGLIAGLAAAYSVSTHEDFIKNNQVSGTIGALLSFSASKFVGKIE